MVREVDHCANALASLGLRKSDRITISMPTSPQGIICFYAINKLGAVASMIHLLSPPTEIEFYLNKSRSEYALTLDAFYRNFREVADRTPLKILILKKISDYFPLVKKVAFHLTKGRKIPKVPDDPMIMLKDQSKEDSDMELELINYCRGHVIKRSCPREIEFRQELPKTLVGKIAFNVLEQEEIARLKSLGKYAGE